LNDGRLTLGFACDHIARQGKDSNYLKELVSGVDHLTAHHANVFGNDAIQQYSQVGLFTSKLTLSHGNGISDEDILKAKEAGVGIVSTPEVELQAHGWPEALRVHRLGCRAGIGHDGGSGDAFSSMRVLLQTDRARTNSALFAKGKLPKNLHSRPEDVLRLATLGSAEVIRREHELGSVEEGKLADIIIIRTDSIYMMGATTDLSDALVFHASASDVDTVIINGEILKRGGTLTKVDWRALIPRVRKSRDGIDERAKNLDMEQNYEDLLKLFNLTGKME